MNYQPQPGPQTVSQSRQVIVRAAVVAILLGSVLTVLNQSAAIFGEAEIQWVPLLLLYLTPFLVVSASQVLGQRAAQAALGAMAQYRESFLATVFSHGIPARALILSIVAAGLSTAIVATENILAVGELGQLPVPQIAQALVLPLVFGALSQALSFRRAVKQAVRPAAVPDSR